MIRFFLAFILMAAGMVNTISANNGERNEYINRYVKINTPFKKIIINGNADVILIKGDGADLCIEGNSVPVNGVRLENYNGILRVFAGQSRSNQKPVIRIPVQYLEILELNGDGRVFTDFMLRSRELYVFINGTCEVTIRSTGKVFFETPPEYQLNYINNKQSKIVSYAY